MAENKFFLVTDKETGNRTVVGAPNRGLIIPLAAGESGAFKLATNTEVSKFFAREDGGPARKPHPASAPTGKYFISDQADGPVLIRAKNAGAAFAAVNADRYEVEQLKTDKLVDLLVEGVPQVRYQASEGADGGEGGEGGGQDGGDGQDEGDHSKQEASTTEGADANQEHGEAASATDDAQDAALAA